MISAMAETPIRALATALPPPRPTAATGKRGARRSTGAWLAGWCLGTVSMGIHHKLCHTLGGMFDLNHADVHAVMLPHSAAFNRDAAPDAMRRAARALGGDDAPATLYDLTLKAATKHSLKEMGLTRAALEKARRPRREGPLRQSAAGDARGDP